MNPGKEEGEEIGDRTETHVGRMKPAREIYKPPNLRRSRSGHRGHSKGHHDQNAHFHSHQVKNSEKPGGVSSGQNSDVGFMDCGPGSRGHGPPLNVNAKEFQHRPTNNQGQQLRKDWNPPGGAFPLVQSKSSGSMFTQFQKYCRQEEESRQRKARHDPMADGVSQSGDQPSNGIHQSGQPNPPQPPPPVPVLQQSKSIGNLRMGRPHVRFFDLETTPAPPESQMASLKIEANNNGPCWNRPDLVKSKSVPRTQLQPFDSTSPRSGPWEPRPDWSGLKPNQHHPQPVQRSKSFGYFGRSRLPSAEPPLEDFQMDRWPKGVVESVKVAMAGGEERVPPRHKIDMVTRIFGTILGDYGSNLTSDLGTDTHTGQFILPAVHIFSYFIQRDADETVLESFLNNSLATYQNLLQGSANPGVTGSNGSRVPPKSKPLLIFSSSTTSKWIIFLKLLTTFYQKTKVMRSTRSLEEFRHRLLSLLCDSCLVVLRLSPHSYTTELVDTLFLVMTSLGRDMEGSFPPKMKSILAGVRDILVGVDGSGGGQRSTNPVHHQGLSPPVHKTLMQLIELYAANWQLPASAVRYYYASIPSSTDQSESIK